MRGDDTNEEEKKRTAATAANCQEHGTKYVTTYRGGRPVYR